MSETFTHNGHEFTLEVNPDYDMRAPWVEHDGHGVVCTSTTRHSAREGDKRPCQRPLNNPSRNEWQYFYDVKASTAVAKRDSWGISAEDIAAFTAKHGKAPTKRQIIAIAVERDFEYLRKYLAGDVAWYWIEVTHTESGESQTLGGILCESGDGYLMECAGQLADEILYALEQREKVLDLHMKGL